MVFMSRSKNVSLTQSCLYLCQCLQIKFRNISINMLSCKYVSGITSLSSQRCGISLPKNRLYIFLFFPQNSSMHVLFYLKHKSNIQSTKGWPIMIDFQKAFLICETCLKMNTIKYKEKVFYTFIVENKWLHIEKYERLFVLYVYFFATHLQND